MSSKESTGEGDYELAEHRQQSRHRIMTHVVRNILLCGVALCLARVGEAQPPVQTPGGRIAVPVLLAQFRSTSDSTRAGSFYALLRANHAPQGFLPSVAAVAVLREFPAEADEIRAGLINLLDTENARVFRTTGVVLAEWYLSYHGDLIDAVASLRDSAAIDVLFDALPTGSMAASGLANLGEYALPKVLAGAYHQSWEMRRESAVVAGVAMERRQVVGLSQGSIGRLRDMLLQLTHDPERFVREHAVRALKTVNDAEVLGRMKHLATDDSDCQTTNGRRSCPVQRAATEWLKAHPTAR